MVSSDDSVNKDYPLYENAKLFTLKNKFNDY